MVDDLLARRVVIGLDRNQVEKLLGTPDLVNERGGEEYLFYILGDQRDYPAKSIWFPGVFPNNDRWMLEIRLGNGKVYLANVFFT